MGEDAGGLKGSVHLSAPPRHSLGFLSWPILDQRLYINDTWFA
jgi:hypothetical protein